MGWITPAIKSLQNKVSVALKIVAVLHVLAAMFDDCIIQAISSDAESREEQDGSKHSFSGQTVAELLAIFQLHVSKNQGKEVKTKDFNFAEEGNFSCKLCSLGPSEQDFMVNNTIVILLL